MRMVPNPMSGALTKWGKFGKTYGRVPCKDRGRDWNAVSTAKKLTRLASNHQKLGERHGVDSPSEQSKGTNLNFELLDSKTVRE